MKKSNTNIARDAKTNQKKIFRMEIALRTWFVYM